ncbi:hypothetical protein GCM10007160_36320 [Litchfieldella qijiaojingensis]|uniref:Peptidase S24/S26A/S26B/S26C domain-containing protein n=1 Tax=Litchfieldella qijiaojingensis TaxID=980347 RepID=A0ABQ2Z8Q3_9GAMM|nr:hypothetical protein GCM10007160_36320 [Halomonas qijiaojingensis]
MKRGASGFPSPADDYLDTPLDLHRHLVPRPSSTFFMQVEGNAQAHAGFHDGDLLVVDRSLATRPGHWVIAVIEGELCLQRLAGTSRYLWLCSAHPNQSRLPLEADGDCRLWGVVSHVIHTLHATDRER